MVITPAAVVPRVADGGRQPALAVGSGNWLGKMKIQVPRSNVTRWVVQECVLLCICEAMSKIGESNVEWTR